MKYTQDNTNKQITVTVYISINDTMIHTRKQNNTYNGDARKAHFLFPVFRIRYESYDTLR